ncbi:hypothetical protein EB810_13820 [Altererythrobacter sp. FM1]|uniref:hypothetical protein n=1 Tax=Tsuneonella flava TaxID=2055955 RepID=UPI000C80D99A|nr:hypothetical protein [Tsuneonella flava]ROT94143.1 hypothetical protein EB810_13820 [Altererythrobacter sp. FM1]
MSEPFLLHPLRIPSGWTLRHNNFVDAPIEHSYWDYDGCLLLAYHAEWDLLIDLEWLRGSSTGRPAEAARFLLRVMHGDRPGRELQCFESRDPAAVVIELERLLADLPVYYLPSVRYADYSNEEVYMLMQLYKVMLKLRSEDPIFAASCQISDVWIESGLMKIAPMVERYWQNLPPEVRERTSPIETNFCPYVLRQCDWTHLGRENEDDLIARLDAHFRDNEG